VQQTTNAYGHGIGDEKKTPSMLFFASLVTIMVLHEIAGNLIFISSMSFFAKISDPSIGGTYMTLLNTISNLGSKWPNSMALWLLPKLTWSLCESSSSSTSITFLDKIDCKQNKKECEAAGGTCNMRVDGYTVQIIGATIVGVLWIFLMRDKVLQLQNLPLGDWLVNSRSGVSTDTRRKD
jgi:PAT family acetyl-CoA transporter-like MFS transporter 1